MSTATTPATGNNSAIGYASFTIDPKSAVHEVAKHWGWLLAAGIISVLGGTVALLAPVLATGLTAMFIAATLTVIGCVNLAGVCFADKGLKLESFLTGVVQVLLAAVMFFYPFESLMSITILIAAFIMMDGIVHTALAFRNRQVPGWGWTLAGGIASIATSVIVMVALPASALWVIGILVGVSMLTTGIARVAIALEGRKIAKATA